jgi:ketosteroid isomerase-like protein
MGNEAAVVRRFVEAFNRGDVDGVFADAGPGFEIDLSRAIGPFRGRYRTEEARRFLGEFADAWEWARIEADEFLEEGDAVLGTWRLVVRGRDGVEVASKVTWVFTVRDGLLTRACMYQERGEALAAAGMKERGRG